MNRMNKKKISRRRIGFTLLEMVLVMAIMVIMSAYLYATFRVVNYSHLEVTVVKDMHDYASLNLQAIANNLCNATSITKDSSTKNFGLSNDASYVTLNNANILPGFTQYHAGNGKAKWGVTLKFKTNPGTKTISVEIALTDHAVPPSGVIYRDVVTVYCPSCVAMEDLGDSGSATIGFTTDPVTPS